jgi:hypothetical protein
MRCECGQARRAWRWLPRLSRRPALEQASSLARGSGLNAGEPQSLSARDHVTDRHSRLIVPRFEAGIEMSVVVAVGCVGNEHGAVDAALVNFDQIFVAGRRIVWVRGCFLHVVDLGTENSHRVAAHLDAFRLERVCLLIDERSHLLAEPFERLSGIWIKASLRKPLGQASDYLSPSEYPVKFHPVAAPASIRDRAACNVGSIPTDVLAMA